MKPLMSTAPMTAMGTLRRGFWVSSASGAAASKPPKARTARLKVSSTSVEPCGQLNGVPDSPSWPPRARIVMLITSSRMTSNAARVGCCRSARRRISGVYGFGVEAEADLAADPRGQVDEAGVVRGPRDGLMQRVIRQPAGIPAGGARVLADRPADHLDVVGGPALGRGARDLLLDEPPVVQQFGQLVPGRAQRALDHLVGTRTRAGLDEGAATAAAPGRHVARGQQSLQRLAHRGPAHLQRGGQVPLGARKAPKGSAAGAGPAAGAGSVTADLHSQRTRR